MDVPRQLIDQEDGASPFPGDGVPDGAVPFVRVRVDLGRTQERVGPGRAEAEGDVSRRGLGRQVSEGGDIWRCGEQILRGDMGGGTSIMPESPPVAEGGAALSPCHLQALLLASPPVGLSLSPVAATTH